MKRWQVLAALAVVFALAGTGLSGPTQPFHPKIKSIAPLAGLAYSLEFEGGKRACAIAIGDGSTYLGLYVYDSHGNCVAWDDEGMPQTRDDVAVDWFPPVDGVYVVEVRNCGLELDSNNCKIVVR